MLFFCASLYLHMLILQLETSLGAVSIYRTGWTVAHPGVCWSPLTRTQLRCDTARDRVPARVSDYLLCERKPFYVSSMHQFCLSRCMLSGAVPCRSSSFRDLDLFQCHCTTSRLQDNRRFIAVPKASNAISRLRGGTVDEQVLHEALSNPTSIKTYLAIVRGSGQEFVDRGWFTVRSCFFVRRRYIPISKNFHHLGIFLVFPEFARDQHSISIYPPSSPRRCLVQVEIGVKLSTHK